MPKWLEDKLKKEAIEKFPGDKERQDSYVYGTLNAWEKKQHWFFRRIGKHKAKEGK